MIVDKSRLQKLRILPLIVIAVLNIAGCRTVEEPLSRAVPDQPVPAEPEAVTEPEPLDMNWEGTAWILPDPEGKSPKEFPGYRGFYLGEDGRLLLLNLDEATGDKWKVEGNRISLSILEGIPGIPLEGTFLVYPDDREEKGVQSIRLVHEQSPGSAGITLNRVKVNIDIVENHWIPKRLKGGDGVMWPMNREIHLMLLPDIEGMGVLGFGGENRFRGGVSLGDESFIVGPLSSTRRTGPASEFEDLYIRRISETNRYVQAGDDLFLYTDTTPTAAFRVRLFD